MTKSFSKYLTASLITSILIGIVLNSDGNGGGGSSGGCSKKDPNCNPPNCTPLTNTIVSLFLYFPASIPNRFCVIPEAGSDPNYVIGSRFKDENKNTYFCKVSVSPNYGTDDCKADYTSVWDVRSFQRDIVVPDNRSFTLTVEFWEKCENYCNGTRFEDTRAYWKYTAVDYYAQSFTAYLNYQYNEYSCIN